MRPSSIRGAMSIASSSGSPGRRPGFGSCSSSRLRVRSAICQNILFGAPNRRKWLPEENESGMPSNGKFGELTWRKLLTRTSCQFFETAFWTSQQSSHFIPALVFPLYLLFLIALLGLLLRSGPVLRETLPTSILAAVRRVGFRSHQQVTPEVTEGSGGGKLSLALSLHYGRLLGHVPIIESFNIPYQVKESRPWWKKRLVALGLTIISSCLIVSALFVIDRGRLSEIMVSSFGFGSFIKGVWKVLRCSPLLGFGLMAFDTLYLYAPNIEHRRWHWLMPGTVVGVALWLSVSFGFKLCLSLFDRFTITYGSIGVVIFLLLWLSVGYRHSDWRRSELGNRKGIGRDTPEGMNRPASVHAPVVISEVRAKSDHLHTSRPQTRTGNRLQKGIRRDGQCCLWSLLNSTHASTCQTSQRPGTTQVRVARRSGTYIAAACEGSVPTAALVHRMAILLGQKCALTSKS